MRRIRYSVVMSTDPAFDFSGLFAQFDTLLVGRRTFEMMARVNRTTMPGMKTMVLSTTLRGKDYPDVTIVGSHAEAEVAGLRAAAGKNIWLFGGGEIFRRLLDAGLVDTVEVTVMPVLLGAGMPLLPPPATQTKLQLTAHHVYKTGTVALKYAVKAR